MNFLSHYYFDRGSDNAERVMGMVLPDLMKNARKEWNIRPEKREEEFTGDEKTASLMEGWKRHLAVDKYFHTSDFFCHHTAQLKEIIKPLLSGSEVRPSFLAHVSLELMLDNILLTEGVVDPLNLYRLLAAADTEVLAAFLVKNGITDTSPFFNFLDDFITSEYLATYDQKGKIIYALTRICMRLWADPFTVEQKDQLALHLLPYISTIKEDYQTIFDEIEIKLIPYTVS